MTIEQSFVPTILLKNGNRIRYNVLATLAGSLTIALLAQISIPVPFSPVPITGQTFGVALAALLLGRWRGFAAVASYLAIGFSGLPVFAFGKAGLSLGPTSGYLIGMMAAAYLMGSLADRGWTKSVWKTWLIVFCGSCVTFSFGVLVLSFYIPKDSLLMAGVVPFIPGDLIKTFLACSIVRQISKSSEKN